MPTSAAAPTSSRLVAVAAFAPWPATYTSTGTARIEPPPPSAPSDTPMRNPSGETRSARISDAHDSAGISCGRLRLTGSIGRPRRTPRFEAAEDVGHTFEAVRAQQRCRDRRPVSARAVHDDRPARVELAETVEQGGQRHRRRAGNDAGRPARPGLRTSTILHVRSSSRHDATSRAGSRPAVSRSRDARRARLRRRRARHGRRRSRSWPAGPWPRSSRPASVTTTIG